VRILYRIDIEERGDFLLFTLRANAFLHHMARNVIGALLQAGQGRQPVSWMTRLLQARDRRLGAPTFMPDGLYLAAVEYPERFELGMTNGGASIIP
jgi:tRNA pseudouridine38-40 synthase